MPRILFLIATLLTALATSASEQLSLRQTSPTDVVLTWQASAGKPGGHIVEYINQPTDEWVILGFVPAGKNTFTHPRLAPGTPYSYRVRPFHGAASAPIEVTVAEGLPDKAYADAYAQPEDYSWAPPATIARPGDAVRALKSLKQPASAAHAAPADFRAELAKGTVSGFKLTWLDRASDEEGFLLEQITGPHDFVVCAVIEPNINAFGWALEPPARKATFRLRAYYYGAASNVVRVVTGGDDGASVARKTKPTS
ncbi:MAG TPA: fibronectin type III domain-containing protein [Opitutaceae bacterium]